MIIDELITLGLDRNTRHVLAFTSCYLLENDFISFYLHEVYFTYPPASKWTAVLSEAINVAGVYKVNAQKDYQTRPSFTY